MEEAEGSPFARQRRDRTRAGQREHHACYHRLHAESGHEGVHADLGHQRPVADADRDTGYQACDDPERNAPLQRDIRGNAPGGGGGGADGQVETARNDHQLHSAGDDAHHGCLLQDVQKVRRLAEAGIGDGENDDREYEDQQHNPLDRCRRRGRPQPAEKHACFTRR